MLRALRDFALRRYFGRHLAAVRRDLADARRAQEETLRWLLAKAAGTAIGRRHGFGEIRSAAEFSRRVPISGYAEALPLWERCAAGERDLIWPGAIPYLAMTSGTTGGNKYIPVTPEAIAMNRAGGVDTLAWYLAESGNYGLFDGHLLFLGGTTGLERRQAVEVGDYTGIMARHIPRFFRRWYTPGVAAAGVADWEDRVAGIAALIARQDLRMLTGVPSWMMILLEKVRQLAGRSTIGEVWPNLALFVHGGMAFGPYRAAYERLIGRPIRYFDTYTATEGGLMALQDRDGEPGMIVSLRRGTFYEFIPLDEVDRAAPTRLPLWEVQTGKPYAVVTSSCNGAWAYLVGDLLQFTCLAPHRVIFAGRTKSFLNAFGEHVIQEELERALIAAAAATGASPGEFTVIPVYPVPERPRPGHRWVVEFAKPPAEPSAFARELDRAIRAGNEDYDVHRRRDYGMDEPRLELVPPGTFYRWLKSRGKLGGQNKFPRVVAEPELIASLERQIAAERRERPA